MTTVDRSQLPKDPVIKSCTQEKSGFSIEWNDNHQSHYSSDWLAKRDLASTEYNRRGIVEQIPWGAALDPIPTVQYKDVMNSEEGLKNWLREIQTKGFCYVDGCPATPEATQELLEKIAFIRHTHYGGFWDFTSDLSSKDTAYTSLALEAHTDTTYFSDPAGLQMFHLLSHTDGEGGASLLVDGLHAARVLEKEDYKAYQTLSRVRLFFHASGNDGISIQPSVAAPVLIHDHAWRHLLQVRWNNADRAAIDLPIGEVDQWYEAAAKFDRILKRKDMELWHQLVPGRPLIFDNWRVLHGRSAFTGKRRMCGGYINRDDFVSRFKMTNFGRDKVLESTVTG
ncbi:hypothetical protein B0A49_08291 [Cryomyces minteri]|uniref:TauD/TfdA-like domain-containing protein n=1 Tax=Cryomyces minteri TaxID=331657 RepID=A0A4U0WPE8_9PEZI|nr:hypothetical protein B0A49_08291 [Cryomyces minteri]